VVAVAHAVGEFGGAATGRIGVGASTTVVADAVEEPSGTIVLGVVLMLLLL
jgi:hypothetical protein